MEDKKPYVVTQFRMLRPLHTKVKKEALNRGLTMQDYIISLLIQDLDDA